MIRRTFVALLMAGLITASPGRAETAAESIGGDARPDVLLIVVDDLNTDLGYLGGPVHTPHLDRLAARGMVFTDAHCNAPVCNPSRTSFLLGQYPPTTGVLDNDTHFRHRPATRSAVTLPQAFRQHGYLSVAAGKIFHNGWKPPTHPHAHFADLEHSWDRYEPLGVGTPEPPRVERDWHRGRLNTWMKGSFLWGGITQPLEDTDDFRNAAAIARQLEATEPGGQPRFLACGIFRPHLPFFAPQRFFDLYPPQDPPSLPGVLESDLDDLPPTALAWARKTGVHGPLVAEHRWGEAVAAYRAATSFADACVGRVLDALDASPRRDRTYVVLISDHGFQLGEKQAWAKFTFWDRVTRVPMIIAGPGITPGRCDAPVSLVDLYPTLLSLAGLPPRDDLAGRDLTALLREPRRDWDHPVYVFHQDPQNQAVIDASYRYIRYADGGEELYDRAADPHDWHNLAGQAEHAPTLEDYRRKRWTPAAR